MLYPSEFISYTFSSAISAYILEKTEFFLGNYRWAHVGLWLSFLGTASGSLYNLSVNNYGLAVINAFASLINLAHLPCLVCDILLMYEWPTWFAYSQFLSIPCVVFTIVNIEDTATAYNTCELCFSYNIGSLGVCSYINGNSFGLQAAVLYSIFRRFSVDISILSGELNEFTFYELSSKSVQSLIDTGFLYLIFQAIVNYKSL